MVQFTKETRIVYTTVLIVTLATDLVVLIGALHNVFRYLCRAGKGRILINIFYLFMIISLLGKMAFLIYLLSIDKGDDFLKVGNTEFEELLYIDSVTEDCFCDVFIIMLYQLTLAIQQMFGSITEKQAKCRRQTAYAMATIMIITTVIFGTVELSFWIISILYVFD